MPLICLITEQALPNSRLTGKYFDQQREARANAQAYNPAARRQLRQPSEQLTGLSG